MQISEDEKNCKIAISKELVELAEAILRRKEDYSSIPLYTKQRDSWIKRYLKNHDVMEEDFREKTVKGLLYKIKCGIEVELMIDSDIPEDHIGKEYWDTFSRWVEEKGGKIDFRVFLSNPGEKINYSKLIKDIIKKNVEGLKFSPDLSGRGLFVFKKKFLNDNEIRVAIDRTILSDDLTVLIGLMKPFFYTDLGNFVSCGPVFFKFIDTFTAYHTSDVVNTIQLVAQYLNLLLPHFEVRLEKVLGGVECTNLDESNKGIASSEK